MAHRSRTFPATSCKQGKKKENSKVVKERGEGKGMRQIEKEREKEKRERRESNFIIRIISVCWVAHTYSQGELDDTPNKAD